MESRVDLCIGKADVSTICAVSESSEVVMPQLLLLYDAFLL